MTTSSLRSNAQQVKKQEIESTSNASNATTPALFSSIPVISDKTLKTLQNDFRYSTMTDVQEQVLKLLPTDIDLLVRAKTGTGKTLAFLIAALESAIARRNGVRFDGRNIPIMVISPTRELALQIAAEAKKLLRGHFYRVETAVGGSRRGQTLELFQRGRMELLVVTPGRIIDMLKSSEDCVKRLQNLECVSDYICSFDSHS